MVNFEITMYLQWRYFEQRSYLWSLSCQNFKRFSAVIDDKVNMKYTTSFFVLHFQ